MAANATDLRLYYSQIIGPTLLLKVGILAAQTSDADGELPEGRYLIQALELAAGRVWIKTVPFVAGQSPVMDTPLTGPMVAGTTQYTEEFPLDHDSGIRSIIVVVRGHRNGRIQAICSGVGQAVLAITRVGDGVL